MPKSPSSCRLGSLSAPAYRSRNRCPRFEVLHATKPMLHSSNLSRPRIAGSLWPCCEQADEAVTGAPTEHAKSHSQRSAAGVAADPTAESNRSRLCLENRAASHPRRACLELTCFWDLRGSLNASCRTKSREREAKDCTAGRSVFRPKSFHQRTPSFAVIGSRRAA